MLVSPSFMLWLEITNASLKKETAFLGRGGESTWHFCVFVLDTLKTHSLFHVGFLNFLILFPPSSLILSFILPPFLPLLPSPFCILSFFLFFIYFCRWWNLHTIPFTSLQDSLYLVSTQSWGSQLNKKTSRRSYIYTMRSTLYEVCKIWGGE